ncbi:MAG TPA: hypothetical protein VGQ83_31860 [Polyangia bacterium]|jgi:hypothetical protein
MTQDLLAYFSSDFTEEDVGALEMLVDGLAQSGRWNLGPPLFVNETDSSSCTRPEDEPIRTVGVLLRVTSRGDVPATPVSEAQRLFDALATFSRERQLELEVQLDETYVGEIRSGQMDRVLREGLLERW